MPQRLCLYQIKFSRVPIKSLVKKLGNEKVVKLSGGLLARFESFFHPKSIWTPRGVFLKKSAQTNRQKDLCLNTFEEGWRGLI